MKREDLKALGLSDELTDKVMNLSGNTIEELKTTTAELKSLKTQLEQANATINTLNEKAKEAENAETLKAQIQSQKEDYEKQITAIKYDHSLSNYLNGIKFSSELVKEAVTAKFKEKQFKLEEGKLLGADDFIKELKEKEPSAFLKEEGNDEGSAGVRTDGMNGQNGSEPPTAFQHFY
ncbi:hypothetical protein EII25_03385 [Erysipelotrichaceae bacterium OH741_COT-311]|nr:hypothetical protein EII25_03385 [Erysipelotrichaceae bacterium OH741_COT-311]